MWKCWPRAVYGLRMAGSLHKKTVHRKQFTHRGRVTYIYVSKLTSIGADYGLSPGRRQAIIWTNTGILLKGVLGTNFTEILIEIYTFSLKKWSEG